MCFLPPPATLILSLACLLCWCVWLNAEPLLLLFHQDPEVARLAADYSVHALAMLPFSFAYTILQKFLQCQVSKPVGEDRAAAREGWEAR